METVSERSNSPSAAAAVTVGPLAKANDPRKRADPEHRETLAIEESRYDVGRRPKLPHCFEGQRRR